MSILAPLLIVMMASDPFDPIASVVMHPRCINCHQDKSPRQTDAKIVHRPLVVRGKDDHGAPTQRCQTCHQKIFDEWNGSMMSNSWRDPAWRAAFLLLSRATSANGECDTKALDRSCAQKDKNNRRNQGGNV